VFCLLATSALAQAPIGETSSKELQEIVNADQAARQASLPRDDAAVQKFIADDRERREKVVALLNAGKVHTGVDFDNASLVFQHGETPGDFLTAHELAILAFVKGRRTSLVATAEDRFLVNIGRVQRFGTQFKSGKDGKMKLSPVSEGHPTDVSDPLRRDLFLPTVTEWQQHPMAEVFDVAMPHIEARWKRGTDAKALKAAANRPMAMELRLLAKAGATKPEATLKRVLEIYHADGLVTPEDYRNAAEILGHSQNSDTLLLGHELAVVAVCRGDKSALPLVADTMDSYLVSLGGALRYRLRMVPSVPDRPELRSIPLATETVRTAFLRPSAKQ
jgi:hypothetical protein